MTTEIPGTGRMRASDPEREEFARIVREAVGEGRLTLDEGDERLAAIYAAKYRDELQPAIADLPRPQPPAPRHPYGRGYFPRHVFGVVLAAGVLIGIWSLFPTHFFWPAIPLVFLTLGLFRHARMAAYQRHPWHRR